MKKLLLMLLAVATFYSCEKQNATLEDEVNFEQKDGALSSEASASDKYSGVFVSHDLELHGEIRIDLNSEAPYPAVVSLLNGKTLKFKAIADKADANIVHFKGALGGFTLDFTDSANVVASDFLVDGRAGNIKVYAPVRGVPPAILFGFYTDDSDPLFSGAWDMLNFGFLDPMLGLPVIEEIIVTHTPTGTMYFDETFGTLEPFIVPACLGGFLPPGTPVVGGITDGFLVAGIDQVVTYAGGTTAWTMAGLAPSGGIDLDICAPLPPSIHGFWSRGPRSGTITILTPPW